MSENNFELASSPFTANNFGWCPACRNTIVPGQSIARLKVGIRTLEQGKFVEYFKSNFYAHAECPQPTMGNCRIHGQSVNVEEDECPVCGMNLRKL